MAKKFSRFYTTTQLVMRNKTILNGNHIIKESTRFLAFFDPRYISNYLFYCVDIVSTSNEARKKPFIRDDVHKTQAP